MAENQPAPTPAADPATPQGTGQQPEGQPAGTPQPEAPQTFSFESFSEDDKKYLAGQGITKQEELTQDALVKLINHGRSSQKTAQERQAELDKLRAAVNGTPAPAAADQPSSGTPAPSAPQSNDGEIDRVTALLLGSTFAQQFPELKEDFTNGTVYNDMAKLGIPIKVNGQVNVDGILAYAGGVQQRKQLESKLEELQKPSGDAIPDANPSAPKQPDLTGDMDANKARIIMMTPGHPRSEEATQFLSELKRKK